MAGMGRAILVAEALFALAILAGLVARRRYPACLAFTAYALSILVLESLIAAWPGRFFNWDFWVWKEAIQAALKLAIVLEVGGRTLWPFAGARRIAGVALVAVVLAATGGLLAGEATDAVTIGRVLVPRVLYATACAFVALLTIVLWFHVPLDTVHKAILLGFVPYLLVFTVSIQLLATFGWDVRRQANLLNNVGFFALLAFWTRAAWRRVVAPDVAPEVLARLQPWAVPAARRS